VTRLLRAAVGFALVPPTEPELRSSTGAAQAARAMRLQMRSSVKEAPPMKISARNVLKGKIVEVKKGATTAHVRIQIAGGAVITSSITNEAVEELRLATGDDAYAVIKASDVMVARD